MKISAAEVEHVAVLARLRLTAAEQTQLTKDLDRILGYMDKLNEVETSNVAPFTPAVERQELREDTVTNQPDAEALLANAPDRYDNFFKVPKIIE
jgi:aspartyl-tRNA(Asn)/glutamyl-tRNA(Gln) amidotransferase subunit C